MPLKTKQVGKYTCSQFGTLESIRVRMFSEQVEPLKHKAAEGQELSVDDQAFNRWLDEWVSVAAVVQPLITREEYAVLSPNEQIELMTAIEEVNEEIANVPITKVSKKKRLPRTQKSTTE
jgi:hypothetical protein